jgi:polyisoprenoid-binding protein YceI
MDFRGGLAAWKAAGQEVNAASGATAAETPEPRDGIHPLDLTESRVQWTGRNLLNRHDGTLKLKSGEVEIHEGRLDGGSFVLDMRGIGCSDLAGDHLHEVLIAHLLSDDFFEVDEYPEASFRILAAKPVAEATPGSPDLKVRGILTLKGIEGEIEFLASTGITAEGKLAAQASFAIDRTRWNVIYGSGKFFRSLGGHLVNDMIEIQLRIVTR